MRLNSWGQGPEKPAPDTMKPVMATYRGKRKVFCRFYPDCLDHAIEQEWPSWTCQECTEYEPEDHPLDYWHAEIHGCIMLLTEVFGGYYNRYGKRREFPLTAREFHDTD